MRGIPRFGAGGLGGGLCTLWALAACGNVTATPPDAAPDAPPPDTPPAPTIHHWIVDQQSIPRTNSEATQLGLDLSGDMIVDNQLGAAFAAFALQGIDMQPAVDAAISRGTILMLGEAALGVGSPTGATFTMYTGADPQPPPCLGATDLVCRRHLTGSGMFGIAAASAHDPPLAGTIANGTLVAGPGHLQVSIVFPGGTPILLDLIGARVRLQPVTAASLGQSVIAGAVTVAQRDAKIYPAMLQVAIAQVAQDCPTRQPPDCGCTAGSLGKTYLGLFDTMPKDCVVTLQEIAENPLIKSLFAPDVTLEGQSAISFGFGVTAVKATFTP